ncbi:phage tail protein [Rhizobium sp. 11515TR]|uniref:phage tail protein n=1 Tax=Rhizobium sp. 11515TR TaxID=2028343 RepID=UPI000BA8CD5E|nr:tail fiber protein [Rhizobium sp. 11515TR]ASW04755.1 hypothetical protein CKA34_01775 [Rhizobium sp. 11515TR]
MDPIIGEIRLFSFDWVPPDWALCDGSEVRISDNPALHAICGFTYGGDGMTKFNLPNLPAQVVMGIGHGPNLTSRSLNDAVGAETVALKPENFAPHNHELMAKNRTSPALLARSPSSASFLSTPNQGLLYSKNLNATNGALLSPRVISTVGGSLSEAEGVKPRNNEQPYLVLNFCICVSGIFLPKS